MPILMKKDCERVLQIPKWQQVKEGKDGRKTNEVTIDFIKLKHKDLKDDLWKKVYRFKDKYIIRVSPFTWYTASTNDLR